MGCMVDSCAGCPQCKADAEQFCSGPATFTYNSPEPGTDATTKVRCCTLSIFVTYSILRRCSWCSASSRAGHSLLASNCFESFPFLGPSMHDFASSRLTHQACLVKVLRRFYAPQGGYSSHVVVNAGFALHVPDNISLAGAAPLLCAGITVYSPLRHYGLDTPGMKLGVIGLGGLGHMYVSAPSLSLFLCITFTLSPRSPHL